MNITEYKLTITGNVSEINDNGVAVTEYKKELIYRGNENIIISESHDFTEEELIEGYDGHEEILFPRHILQKFMEMIDE